MKRKMNRSLLWLCLCLPFCGSLWAQPASPEPPLPELNTTYKGSKVSFHGQEAGITQEMILTEAKLIDIADRRFESKWRKKDYKGISMEYTEDGVFMKPGVKPRVGRDEIADEFSRSVQGVDKVEFFQDELEFYGDLTVAYQRAHMKGYVDHKTEHIFEGSYIIYWKKVGSEWLIQYDMFNSDLPARSEIRYFGKEKISRDQILEEAQLIYVADRRFESKWKNKDYVGISEEYTEEGIFMKPGVKPRVGRAEIAGEFKSSVQGIDEVKFFQDDLEFQEGMTSAFQRAHMEGYVKDSPEPVFFGSYTILWKKVDGNWLIHYDMFNADQ